MYHTSPNTREEVSSSPRLRLLPAGQGEPRREERVHRPHAPSVLARPPTPGAAASTFVTASSWRFPQWRGGRSRPQEGLTSPLEGDLSLLPLSETGSRKPRGKAVLRFACVILNDDGQQAAARALERHAHTHTRARPVEVWARRARARRGAGKASRSALSLMIPLSPSRRTHQRLFRSWFAF